MKSMIIKCKIGNVDISNKAIESFNIVRKATDVSDSFTMDFIDSPIINDSFKDLEIYMNAGGRSISVRYGDTIDKLIAFKGTIWDYQITFVGDIKKLQITGYLTKTEYLQDESGSTWAYNIDWNNYLNLRAEINKPWNIETMQNRSDKLTVYYSNYKKGLTSDNSTFEVTEGELYQTRMSDILDPIFKELFTYNTTFMKVKGPVGTINLPIPDSFVSAANTKIFKDEDTDTKVDFIAVMMKKYWDVSATNVKYQYWKDNHWEKAERDDTDHTVYITDEYYNVRGFFEKDANSAYIQVNPRKEYAGAGFQVFNSFGVSPSEIVRKLAVLEGWEIGNIVDTELVVCGDTFKMKNQSALDFIYNNLVPVSVMPTGVVTLSDGVTTRLSTAGTGGYVPYFKNGKFYYEPINSNLYKDRTEDTNLQLGYNIKNSPVLSFQVDTKGTVFYTVQPLKVSTMSLATGKEDTTIQTTSTAAILEYNKVAEHNEGLDSFLGYSYSESETAIKANNSTVSSLWAEYNGTTETGGSYSVIVNSVRGDTNPYDPLENDKYVLNNPQAFLNGKFYSDSYISTLAMSAKNSDTEIRAKLEDAKAKIGNTLVKATLTMWGDVTMSPMSIIKITNMVKTEDALYPSQHPTSGKYLVIQQTDRFDNSGFIQTLNMYRYTRDVQSSLDANNINWSKGITAYQYSLKTQKNDAAGSSTSSATTESIETVPQNGTEPPSDWIKDGKYKNGIVKRSPSGEYYWVSKLNSYMTKAKYKELVSKESDRFTYSATVR